MEKASELRAATLLVRIPVRVSFALNNYSFALNSSADKRARCQIKV